MPKTKLQDLSFTVLMVFVMVYGMTLYNGALESGLAYASFAHALRSMWPEAVAAFLAQRYVAGPMVRRLVARSFRPGRDPQIFVILTTAGYTVALMAPLMTLFVTFLHHGLTAQFLVLWLPKLVLNAPFALFYQVFCAGPLVRRVFRLLFRRQLARAAQPAQAAPADAAPCDNA